jgi:DNA-directed RNA polymerase II subunit RPB2
MLSEEHRWSILGDHFKKKGFVHHQIESFNHFINVDLSKIITEEPPIVISHPDIPGEESKSSNYKSYTVQFSDVYIPKPTVTEEDRSLRGFCPGEARQRDLTYDAPVYVTITTTMDPGGNLDPEVERHIRVVIGRIPIMSRSSHCHLTDMTPHARIKAGECEYDSGGYFIVKGKERVLIPQLRGVYNIPLVLKRKVREKFKYIAEIRSMSEETGHSVLLQALIGVDNRTLVFSLPYIKEYIPMGVVFKALGYIEEKQIRDLIGLDCDLTSRYVRLIVRDAFFCDEQSDGMELFMLQDDKKDFKDQRSKFILEKLWSEADDDERRVWKNEMTRNNALYHIGKFTLHTLKEDKRCAYARQVVESELFPHMGITSTHKEKAYLLGHIVNRLLSTSVGMRKDDDRDDYRNKRVESAGVLCRDLFRQLFKKFTMAIVSSIEKKKQNPDAMAIISRLPIITKGLRHCFGTGNWGVPKNSYIRSGVAQILSRLSYGATLSHLRRLTIPVGKESKNTKIRQIHPSQIMYICPSETPEGQPVGIVLNLSLLTRISERFPTVLAKEVIEDCEELISLRDFDGPNDKTKVFLNGSLVGMTDDSDSLLEEIIQLRSLDMLPYDVSISYDDIDNELHVLSDDGRLLRPVFTVEGDQLVAKEVDGTNWDSLVEKGCIQYIDNSEINDSVVAFYQNELQKYHNDYCEIAPAMMLGVMASIIPFPDHSQSPRNCYQAAMGKQAMSMFALSHLLRADTVTHVLSYPQKPLVSTRAANMMGFSEMPSGINTVVAIACYSGFNQEDSIILNKGAVDRGLFWATTYRTHSGVEKKRGTYNFEKIGAPPLDKRRGDANYSLLDENGIVRLRHPIYTDEKGKKCGGGAVFVQKGDAIIGKILIHSSKSGDEELSDNSLVLRKGEDGYVDRIFVTTTPDGYKLVKVVIRKIRIPEVGDKFASRSAQKGTCGMIYPQEDMPWTRAGMTPDLIMNPHALPSRMTINQLMESVLGKACCIDGKLGDATPFSSSSINIAEKLCSCLGMSNKFERTGKEMLYNGMTGQPMGMVFIGTVYYQRLKHLVDDKMHARAQGPNATLTRQPLEGRSRDGGLRFGEMERDCMMGHGASRFLKERLCDQSDPYTATICSKCENFSTSRNYCKACDSDQISHVNLPYVSKLVIQELNAILIKCKITAKGEI